MPTCSNTPWLTLTVILVAGPAAAGRLPPPEIRYSKGFEACLEAAADTTQQRRCYQSEFARLSAELNAVDDRMRTDARGDEGLLRELGIRREAALDARKAVCRFESLDAETGAPELVYDQCQVRRTAERIIMLEAGHTVYP